MFDRMSCACVYVGPILFLSLSFLILSCSHSNSLNVPFLILSCSISCAFSSPFLLTHHTALLLLLQSLGSVAAFAYESVSRVCTVLALNYYICPFVSLGWDSGILVWANFWFIGHIGTMVLLVLLAFVPAVKHHKHHAHKKE